VTLKNIGGNAVKDMNGKLLVATEFIAKLVVRIAPTD